MHLSDLRRAAVKRGLRIRFAIGNGMECLINEHGVAQVPALRAVPHFNLEQELAGAQQFLVEAAVESPKDGGKAKPRAYSREEMAAFTESGSGAERAGHEEHDE